MVPATTFAAAPTRMASKRAIASFDLTSPTKIAESPNRRVERMPMEGSTSDPGAESAQATLSEPRLYPNIRRDSWGNSKVSSIVIILVLRGISTRKLPSKLLFPLDLVPATRMAALLSSRKLSSPDAKALIILTLG